MKASKRRFFLVNGEYDAYTPSGNFRLIPGMLLEEGTRPWFRMGINKQWELDHLKELSEDDLKELVK